MSKKATETVKVMVRSRPMNSQEDKLACKQAVFVDREYNQIKLVNHKNNDKDARVFTFDAVYGAESIQQEVYDECGFSLVESVLKGYNGTMFAYGQTGCGKSHTMMGPPHEDGPSAVPEDQRGIIPKAIRHIFGFIDDADRDTKFLVRCSYLEIYNEKVLDLLSNKKDATALDIKEDANKGTYVKGLTSVITKGTSDTEKALFAGLKNRKTGETAMNKDSSRSHSIFTIYVEQATDDKASGKQKIKVGKLNLVDLAGSERQSKTHAVGIRLDEAKNINLSLSALGNVIKALVDGAHSHIPYRDSKLTRLLSDSLGGNTKTVMVAALSPADYNYEETLSTLRYADRAKSIKNKPRINEDPKDALLREYQDEITKLKEMLQAMQSTGATSQQMNVAFTNMQQQMQAHSAVANVEENVDQLLMKLESQGKKVKILTGDEEAKEQEEKTKMQQKMQELMALEEDRQRLHQDKEQIEAELDEKDQLLEIEKQEKQAMEDMIQEMNAKLVSGGQQLEEAERDMAVRNRQASLNLKKQRKVAKKLAAEKQEKEEEMLMMQEKFSSVEDEVKVSRQIIKKWKYKYDTCMNEINDLKSENVGDREDLMIQLRQQEYDVKFYQRICENVMKTNEMAKLKSKSHWDDGQNDWIIPPFVLKQRAVELPSLSIKKQAQDYMEQQKNDRELVYDDDYSDDEYSSGGQGSYLQQYEHATGNNGHVAMSFNSKGGQNGSGQNKKRSQNWAPEQEAKQIQQQNLQASHGRKHNGTSAPEKQWMGKQWQQHRSEQSQSQLATMGNCSPDPLQKNSKAMANLAPLHHFTPALPGAGLGGVGALGPTSDVTKSSQGQLPHMPSFEQLQTYNKLAPLNHMPNGRGRRPN